LALQFLGSEVASVTRDIKLQLANFSSATFVHVHRSLNEAAHILARAYDVSSLGFISNFALICIRKILCNDVIAKSARQCLQATWKGSCDKILRACLIRGIFRT
jgi:hypothetical protein